MDYISYANRVSTLQATSTRCITPARYVDAANLVEIGGTVVEEIRQSLYQTIDPTPLLPGFWRACERYDDEIYSPQVELCGSEQDDAFMLWSRYSITLSSRVCF